MNGWEALEAVGWIDDAFIEEAGETPVPAKVRRQKRAVAVAACVAVTVAAAVCFALGRLPRIPPEPSPGEEGSVVYETPSGGGAVSRPGEAVTGQVTSAASAGETSRRTTDPSQKTTEPSPITDKPPQPPTERTEEASLSQGGDASGDAEKAPETVPSPDEGSYGGPTLPNALSADGPAARGTGYTRQEVDALLEQAGYGIAQTVAAETGCAPEDVRICHEGYCHTSLGEENYYDLDYLTLPVCVGETVVASVDLFRVDREPHYSVSAGGPRWANLNRALQYGQVAFAYAGFGEVAVAADGTVFPITVGAEEAVAGIDGLYERVAAPQTVFSLARLRSALTEAG